MKQQVTFKELSKAKIKENKNVVISEKSNGGFIIAQQIIFKDEEKELPVFLKGAINVEDINGLYNLRDALNESIAIVESEK